LSAAVAPGLFAPARWPGPGRHPLVLLQQAAVNLAIRELKFAGILAVNGPPGTGKTTLLRDIVAALVTARGEVMATFDDPSTAFEHSGEKLPAGTAWLHLYRLSPKLRGFEILVASSNNKAVENVSAELPGLAAVAEDAIQLRYLSSLSNGLLGRETWGLIAAVLGNAINRARFRQTFWWDKELGLSTYLAAAAGTPQIVDVINPDTGEKTSRPPRIVTAENAPRDRNEALQRWQKSCKEFASVLQKSKATLQELESVRILSESLPQLKADEAKARSQAESQCLVLERAIAELAQAEATLTRLRGARESEREPPSSRSRPARLLEPPLSN
jgi:energy-coupling factor transporter ATP-binding protein EcfA2